MDLLKVKMFGEAIASTIHLTGSCNFDLSSVNKIDLNSFKPIESDLDMMDSPYNQKNQKVKK